jgi:tetratricopeptide (TPR) repeat protein
MTYHQLGIIAQEQGDFATAEQWYRKSLAIDEKLGNEHGAAVTYHQLGRIAHEQRDFAMAEQWYSKSFQLAEKSGNVEASVATAFAISRISLESDRILDAAKFCVSGILAARRGFKFWIASGVQLFTKIYFASPSLQKPELIKMWNAAALGELPESIREERR